MCLCTMSTQELSQLARLSHELKRLTAQMQNILDAPGCFPNGMEQIRILKNQHDQLLLEYNDLLENRSCSNQPALQ